MSGADPGPVVILGMHRSGTTLLAELARGLGIELGRVTELQEPQPVVAINDWILRRSGGSWEYPRPALGMLAVPELREEAQAQVHAVAARHLARLAAGPGPWGWKDPRTAFTLPLWEAEFPRMRLLVVRRHGFDAALSLHARAQVEHRQGRSPLAGSPLSVRVRNLFLRHEEGRTVSVRSRWLAGALALWGDYNRRLDEVVSATTHPLYEVKLEELLAAPAEELRRLAGFLELDDATARVERALDAVELRDASRVAEHHLVAAAAHRDDLELVRSYGYAASAPEAAA
jgi:hypothetical protein